MINTIKAFELRGIDDCHTQAKMLLCHVLKQSSSELYSYPDYCLNENELSQLRTLVDRRMNYEPVSYILENREFYGLNFYVNRHVLIPRPETELLVEEALKFCIDLNKTSNLKLPIHIADVGTGCGAIAISLADFLDNVEIYAIDVSKEALNVAKRNSLNHSVMDKVHLVRGNLLDVINTPLDLIVANLPYIDSSEVVSLCPEISGYEPILALDGGKGGLQIIEDLINSIGSKSKKPGCILLEIGYNQSSRILDLIHRHLNFSSVQLIKDFGGIKRVVKISL